MLSCSFFFPKLIIIIIIFKTQGILKPVQRGDGTQSSPCVCEKEGATSGSKLHHVPKHQVTRQQQFIELKWKHLSSPRQKSFTRSFHFSPLRRKGKKISRWTSDPLSLLPFSTFKQTPTFSLNPLLIRSHATPLKRRTYVTPSQPPTHSTRCK